jgi:hypothetical protein
VREYSCVVYFGRVSLIYMKTLYRAANDDIITDCASFAETAEAARLYLDNPGFGGRTLYRAEVEIDAAHVLDVTDSYDATAEIAERAGQEHPGAIGADEYAARVSYELRDAGVEWVVVRESYPAETTTWIWVGGDEPEMIEED